MLFSGKRKKTIPPSHPTDAHDPAGTRQLLVNDRQSQLSTSDSVGTLLTPERMELLKRFADIAYLRYLKNAPCLTHLPTVIHVNVLNALACNAAALGLSDIWLLCEASSPFGLLGPALPTADNTSWPDCLRPTELQLKMPHHPWIDLFPIPRLRDNIIWASVCHDYVDEDELWYDLVEMDTSLEASQSPSLIAWGQPWDVGGWEVSVSFLREWGYLLNGCPEVLDSTNIWRERRGDKRLRLMV